MVMNSFVATGNMNLDRYNSPGRFFRVINPAKVSTLRICYIRTLNALV